MAWVGLMLCCPLLGYELDWIKKFGTPVGKTCALGFKVTSFFCKLLTTRKKKK